MDIALKKVRPSHLLLVLALALVAASSQAVAFMPILHNFGKKVYGGALQNWDVTQGKNGEIYVGNSAGVLRFDGYTWKLTPLPGGGVVGNTAVCADVGGGYLPIRAQPHKENCTRHATPIRG